MKTLLLISLAYFVLGIPVSYYLYNQKIKTKRELKQSIILLVIGSILTLLLLSDVRITL